MFTTLPLLQVQTCVYLLSCLISEYNKEISPRGILKSKSRRPARVGDVMNKPNYPLEAQRLRKKPFCVEALQKSPQLWFDEWLSSIY